MTLVTIQCGSAGLCKGTSFCAAERLRQCHCILQQTLHTAAPHHQVVFRTQCHICLQKCTSDIAQCVTDVRRPINIERLIDRLAQCHTCLQKCTSDIAQCVVDFC